MEFRPQSVRGAPALAGAALPGAVDYRLARRHVIAEFHRKRLSRTDVCDAHPELIRAARNVGSPTTERCPICEDADLVHVTYVFGERLPAHGRCVTTLKEVAALTKASRSELACYVVEVCPDCRWNHLARHYVVAPRRRRA